VVLCVRCGREPVTEFGGIKYLDGPPGPLCTDCFYQTSEGREGIERGHRMLGFEPHASRCGCHRCPSSSSILY
jgi:hypothetical protein